jgi:hypothetical protein
MAVFRGRLCLSPHADPCAPWLGQIQVWELYFCFAIVFV